MDFYINRNSVNPVLRMRLFDDGRFDFKRSLINNALQDSHVFFSMKDKETGILKIAKEPAEIKVANSDSCEEEYVLQYSWKPRDVKKEGFFVGWFDIEFNGNIVENGIEYPQGNLKVPIQEELNIIIKTS